MPIILQYSNDDILQLLFRFPPYSKLILIRSRLCVCASGLSALSMCSRLLSPSSAIRTCMNAHALKTCPLYGCAQHIHSAEHNGAACGSQPAYLRSSSQSAPARASSTMRVSRFLLSCIQLTTALSGMCARHQNRIDLRPYPDLQRTAKRSFRFVRLFCSAK